MKVSCGYLLCCYVFCLLFFSPILINLHTLCHFNSGEVDYRSRIRVPPGGGVFIYQFYVLLLKHHHKLILHILKREDSSLLHPVIQCGLKNNVSATCIHCATLTAVRYILKVELGFLLVVVSPFNSFPFFCSSTIIN